MAALSYGPGVGQYNLHTIVASEPHSTWSQKPLQMDVPDGLTVKSTVIQPSNLIALGGGLLGWVDLWKGIVICDVLDPREGAAASFVPMPKLLPSNSELYGNQHSARSIRDVTFSRGYIKCVEFEELVKLRPARPQLYHLLLIPGTWMNSETRSWASVDPRRRRKYMMSLVGGSSHGIGN